MRRGTLLALAILAAGCQTSRLGAGGEVPTKVQRRFAVCSPTDGSAALKLFDAGALQGSAEVSWVSRSPTDWQLEVSNALGQTLLTVTYKGQRLVAAGRLAARLPALGVGDGQILEVNGEDSGLRAPEIPCLLAGHFPRTWLAFLAADSGGDDLASGKDSLSREFRVYGPRPSERAGLGSDPLCTEVAWRHWLLWHPSWTWCVGGADARHARGRLTGYEDDSLTWTRLDDR